MGVCSKASFISFSNSGLSVDSAPKWWWIQTLLHVLIMVGALVILCLDYSNVVHPIILHSVLLPSLLLSHCFQSEFSFFLYRNFILLEVQLIYNVVLISAYSKAIQLYIYNGLQLLIPNSHSISSLNPFHWQPQVYSLLLLKVCFHFVSFFVSYYRFHM